MYTEDSLFLSNQIFVAPDGRDSASGQKDAPLQPLEAALRRGKQRPRAALPKNGFYRIESVPGQTLNLPYNVSSDRFIVKEGDFFPTRNLNDVLAHVFHYWSDEQMPVKSFDPETRLLVSSIGSCYTLHEDTKKDYARYRLENVFEGLTEPGDWYLDRAARTLYYLPHDDETLANTMLTAPMCEQAFRFRSCADVTVENITVRHFDWHIGEEKIGGQGVCTLPGVVSFDHCTRCALKNSRVEHVGYYCVDIQNSASLRRPLEEPRSDRVGVPRGAHASHHCVRQPHLRGRAAVPRRHRRFEHARQPCSHCAQRDSRPVLHRRFLRLGVGLCRKRVL